MKKSDNDSITQKSKANEEIRGQKMSQIFIEEYCTSNSSKNIKDEQNVT